MITWGQINGIRAKQVHYVFTFFEDKVCWLRKVGQSIHSNHFEESGKVRGWWIVGGTRSTAVVGKLAPSSTSLPPPWHYYQGRLQSFPTKTPSNASSQFSLGLCLFHSTHPPANFRQIGRYLTFLPYLPEIKSFAFIHSPSTHWQSKTYLNLSGLFLWWLQFCWGFLLTTKLSSSLQGGLSSPRFCLDIIAAPTTKLSNPQYSLKHGIHLLWPTLSWSS